MNDSILIICGIILLICALSSKVMYRVGIPTLVIFLGMGMLMGSDGIGGIYFDNPNLAEQICNFGLIFIMFSGGFGTNWKEGKPVALMAGILASLGVVLTALLIGLFCWLVLGFKFLEGMLLGSIISSTDAASVFSILRSKSLNLKNNLASLLEIESGSNDPTAYMLTTIVLGFMTGKNHNVILLLASQVIIGALMGFILGKFGVWLINKINLDIEGLYVIVIFGLAIFTYGITGVLNGNGFLSVYIMGIYLGNKKLLHKVMLVRFFDGLSWLMQVLLFFTLGLLSFPSEFPDIALQGIAVSIFIIFIARPLAVCPIMAFFKRPFKEQILVSWVGFRGAAAIVFATYPLAQGIPVAREIFNTVFFVAVVSVLVQGTLFIPLARKLGLSSEEGTVLKTFTDYTGEIHAELLEIIVDKENHMIDKKIMDLNISDDMLIVMIKRGDTLVTPRGNTKLCEGDIIMVAADNKEQLLSMGEFGV